LKTKHLIGVHSRGTFVALECGTWTYHAPKTKNANASGQIAIGSGTAVVLAILTIALSRLEPAAPSVDADTLYTG
jgi:hypothetical protein